MAFGIRSIYLSGNVGHDAELKNIGQKGTALLSFSMAVSRSEGPGKEAASDWYKVNVWGQYAENLAGTIFKGAHVFVSGEIQQRQYAAKDGTVKTSVEVNANRVATMLKDAPSKPAVAHLTSSTSDETDLPW